MAMTCRASPRTDRPSISEVLSTGKSSRAGGGVRQGQLGRNGDRLVRLHRVVERGARQAQAPGEPPAGAVARHALRALGAGLAGELVGAGLLPLFGIHFGDELVERGILVG